MSYNFSEIRSAYEYLTPIIMERGKKYAGRWVDPYFGMPDWLKMFSPIEMQTWMALRSFGPCPLYPQYPVGRFFADFGNPVVKVAVECDGKQWHTDKEKDKKRDKYFDNLGWTVYRISGADCFRVIDDTYLDYEDERENIDMLTDIFKRTVEGLIESIAIFYFDYRTYNPHVNKTRLAFNCLSDRISVGKYKFQEKASGIMSRSYSDVPDEIRLKTLWL